MDETMAKSTERPKSRSTAVVTRVVRIVGWTSIVIGVLILGFVAQQLFVTTWFAQQNQAALVEEVESHFTQAEITEVEYVFPSSIGTSGQGTVTPGAGGSATDPGAPLVPKSRTVLVESTPEKGTAFAIIRVPTIDRLKDGWTVVEGVGVRDLRNGAGHMPNTPLPGQPGNAVISGHRTTYGAPFHNLDELVPGDLIEVDTALGTHTYAVRETIIVRPTELWVTEPRDGAWLTLTTCHPKFSSRQRLVVFAELVDGPNWEAIYA
ncbi:MAG TPA: sortase [Acidimicrobiia bacterium]|nr:sortase [Acidimicrobiia bacterium]